MADLSKGVDSDGLQREHGFQIVTAYNNEQHGKWWIGWCLCGDQARSQISSDHAKAMSLKHVAAEGASAPS